MNDLKFNDIYDIVSLGVKRPDFAQGESLLHIKRCEAEDGHGNGNSKVVKFICEDKFGNNFVETFFVKNGISNNLAKFIIEALGYEPQGEFNIKQLEGKKIKATITHFYNDNGLGYANIAFCEPAND